MKIFKTVIFGIQYEVFSCTAIPGIFGLDENERQNALLVTARPITTEINGLGETVNTGVDYGAEVIENIVFGWEMPKNEESFLDMLEDDSAWDTVNESMVLV